MQDSIIWLSPRANRLLPHVRLSAADSACSAREFAVRFQFFGEESAERSARRASADEKTFPQQAAQFLGSSAENLPERHKGTVQDQDSSSEFRAGKQHQHSTVDYSVVGQHHLIDFLIGEFNDLDFDHTSADNNGESARIEL